MDIYVAQRSNIYHVLFSLKTVLQGRNLWGAYH